MGILSWLCMVISHSSNKKKQRDPAIQSSANLPDAVLESPAILQDVAVKPWSNLPADIISLILDRLYYSDQIRFMAVCKSWRNSNTCSVKYADTLPWKFAFGYRFCHLYDPSHKREYSIEEQQLAGAKVLASKHGWMLLGTQDCFGHFYSLFFYSPFTNKCIDLPPLYSRSHVDKATFSESPASSECEIFGVLVYPEHVCVSMCSLGNPRWTQHRFDGFYGDIRGLVHMNGVLYLDCSHGILLTFNAATKQWKCYQHNPIPIHLRFFTLQNRLIESDGDLSMVFYDALESRWRLLRIDWPEMQWHEVESLENKVLFIGITCMLVPAVGEASELANTVHVEGMDRSFSYLHKATERDACPQPYGWITPSRKSMNHIWIQPPQLR